MTRLPTGTPCTKWWQASRRTSSTPAWCPAATRSAKASSEAASACRAGQARERAACRHGVQAHGSRIARRTSRTTLDELDGSRDVYNAAEGGRADRQEARLYAKQRRRQRAARGQGAVPDPAGKAKSAAHPCKQAAEMRAKSNGAAGATRLRRPRTRPQALPWRYRPRQSERRWLALAPPQPPQPQRPREPRAPQGQSPAPAYP